MEVIQTKTIPLKELELNNGQIPGLPPNPRFIQDEAFFKLKESIKNNPGMLELRELLVFEFKKKFVIIGGNMRYRALRELDATEAQCKIIPPGTTIEQLRAYTLKDNAQFGEWDFEQLTTWDQSELDDWNIEMPDRLDPDELSDDFALDDSEKHGMIMRFFISNEQNDKIQSILGAQMKQSPEEALMNVIREWKHRL